MSLQQLLRLGAPGLTQGDVHPDHSSHTSGQNVGGRIEPSALDLSAAVAKAASFLEKQKAARLRGERRREDASHGDRDRDKGRERSRSRKKDAKDAKSRPERTRSRRERSGSRAKAMTRTSRTRQRSAPVGSGSGGAVGSRRPTTPRSRPSSRDRLPSPAVEQSLQEAPLRFAGRIGPIAANSRSSGWISVIADEKRRSWVSYRSGAFKEEQLRKWFDRLLNGLNWERPEVNGKLLPRSACWLTTAGCSCTYRYSGTSWPNMVMPPWFVELTDEVCRACEVPERPNSCNANLYEDGGDSVGWHSDDEPYFNAKHSDALIISLSLGATRSFLLRPNNSPLQKTKVSLENGDLATMEGLLQKHYSHAVLADSGSAGVRINLTWRWVVAHDRGCAKRLGNGRSASEPVKVPRKAAEISESKAAAQAAAILTAARVQSSAMQVAAASAASAKLSRTSSAAPATRSTGQASGRAMPVLRPLSPGAARGDRHERRDRPTSPKATLMRLPEELSTTRESGRIPELSEIVDKARRLMGPETGGVDGSRSSMSTGTDPRSVRDRGAGPQERSHSKREQANEVGRSSASRHEQPFLTSQRSSRDVAPGADARHGEDGREEHRSRRQVSLKQADLSSGTGRQSANPAVNALDAQIYTKALKLMGPPDAPARGEGGASASTKSAPQNLPAGSREKTAARSRVQARVWKASSAVAGGSESTPAESDAASSGAAGTPVHRPRPTEPQVHHRSDARASGHSDARSDKKTVTLEQSQRKVTKVDLQRAPADVAAASQGSRHDKLVLTPRHATGSTGSTSAEPWTYSAGAASLTAQRGLHERDEPDRSWRNAPEVRDVDHRGHRGDFDKPTSAELDQQIYNKAMKLLGSEAVPRGTLGASSPRGESAQSSPVHDATQQRAQARVWRAKERGETSSRGAAESTRTAEEWDEGAYAYSEEQYREPAHSRRTEGRPLPPRPPLARPRQVVLKSRSRSPKSYQQRDNTQRHSARAQNEEDDRSYRGADRPARGVQANGERFYSYEEHRGPGAGSDDAPYTRDSRGDTRGSGQARHTRSTAERSGPAPSIAERLAECDSRPREVPRSHGGSSRWQGSNRR